MYWGLAGLLGSIAVGTGEWLMQYTADGKLDMSYDYFLGIPKWRLTFGHFLCVLSAPLYFLGYMHLGRMLDRSNGWLGKSIAGLGIYSFAVGGAWIGGRVYLAIAKKGIASGDASSDLLQSLADHNEPLIVVLRIAILLISIAWIYSIASGRSRYPKWMLAFSPLALLVTIFLSYTLMPSVGKYLLPTAMNLTHFILFSLSLLHLRKTPESGA